MHVHVKMRGRVCACKCVNVCARVRVRARTSAHAGGVRSSTPWPGRACFCDWRWRTAPRLRGARSRAGTSPSARGLPPRPGSSRDLCRQAHVRAHACEHPRRTCLRHVHILCWHACMPAQHQRIPARGTSASWEAGASGWHHLGTGRATRTQEKHFGKKHFKIKHWKKSLRKKAGTCSLKSLRHQLDTRTASLRTPSCPLRQPALASKAQPGLGLWCARPTIPEGGVLHAPCIASALTCVGHLLLCTRLACVLRARLCRSPVLELSACELQEQAREGEAQTEAR